MPFRFGEFELFPERYELRRSGKEVALEPKVLEVLVHLVRRRGEVVPKAELLDAVWEETYVTESALTRTIRELRKAFRDSPARPEFIKTVYGRGYAFVADVEEMDGARASTPAPLPRASSEASRQPETGSASFVGRVDEMARLTSHLERQLAGAGRLVMLVGEPGIGKTRTAEVLATAAAERGARVLWSRSIEGFRAPAYWCWVQILRSYVEELDLPTLVAELGPGAAEIAEIVPEIRARLPELEPPPPLADPEQARFRLFDSVSRFLRRAAGRQPLLLVLDDLHWADPVSLRLLEVLAHEVARSPILVLGTYRQQELSRRHPLSDTLAELGRGGLVERVVLGGLPHEDVARYLGKTAGRIVPAELTRLVHAQTDGNPFFLVEVARLLMQEGFLGDGERPASERPRRPASLRLPEGVREVVGRRLNRLSDGCGRALAAASALGRVFELRELERVLELSASEVLALVDEAIDSGLVQEVEAHLARYQFAHAFIRETLYDELSPSRRIELHRRVGEALEEIGGRRGEPLAPRLAHHFFEAAPGGEAGKALTYNVEAGRGALALLAHEEAVWFFRRALEAFELAGSGAAEERCRLLLDLGQALAGAGETGDAVAIFQRAADAARAAGSVEALAEAALGMEKPGALFGLHAEPVVGLLEEALEALGTADSVLRVRLLAGLAVACLLTRRFQRGHELSVQALAVARRLGDPASVLTALRATIGPTVVGERPEKAEEQLAKTDEMLELAEQLGETYALADTHGYRAHLWLGLGRTAELRREIESYRRRWEVSRLPFYQALEPIHRGSLALLEGRFEEAERHILDARATGRRVHFEDSEGVFASQMFALRRLQGRLEEIAPAVRLFVGDRPPESIWRPGLAVIYLDLGRLEEAAGVFASVAEGGLEAIAHDVLWHLSLVYLGEVAAALGDQAHCGEIYELLQHAELGFVTTGGGIACVGAAGRYLAELAAACGRAAAAERHFETALTENGRAGAAPWLALTERSYAEFLVARGAAGDAKRARALSAKALAGARGLGMRGLEARCLGPL